MSIHFASAIPAYPHPIEIEQPDGTTITVQLFGDEFYHYTLSSDGYQIVQLDDGFYYYYTPEIFSNAATRSIPTVRYNDPSRRTQDERNFAAGISKGVDPSYEAIGLQAAAIRRSALESSRTMATVPAHSPQQDRAFSVMFPQKNIVILAQFSDVKFQSEHTSATFTAMLNQKGYSVGGAIGSSKDYFIFNSRGEYEPEFIVTDIVTLPNSMSYYGANSGDFDARPAQMIFDACSAANASVNFADYDINNDEIIDAVFVFYAGYNEAEGGPANSIWPHRSDLRGYGDFDGKKIGVYACTSELSGRSGANLAGIGTFTHEFGHVIGLPDLYDTDYAGSGGTSVGFYNISIMSGGGYNAGGHIPPTYIAYERRLLGWAEPVSLTSLSEDEITIMPMTQNPEIVYYIPTATEGEVFLLESHANESWDEPLDGTGLIITQVRAGTNAYESAYQTNRLNVTPDNMYVRAIESNGSTIAFDDYNRIAYPGARNVTKFGIGSYGFESWEGVAPSVELKNIVNEAGTVTLSIEVTANLSVEASQREALVSFISGDKWTLEYKETSATNWNTIEVTNSNTYKLTGLNPDTEYEAKATSTSVSDETTFTTLPLTANTSALSGLKSSYTVGDTYAPMITNISDSYTSLLWEFDGFIINSDNLITFDMPGYYDLTCTISYQDGSTEVLKKTIMVVSQ